MRADIQRKPLGYQELTSPNYRCASICVTRLTRSQQILARSLVSKTKGILERTDRTEKQRKLIQDWKPWEKSTGKNSRVQGKRVQKMPLKLAKALYSASLLNL